MTLRTASIAALAAVFMLCAAAPTLLKETGSTLLFPVMNSWVAAYE